jgi:hypothetical protein
MHESILDKLSVSWLVKHGGDSKVMNALGHRDRHADSFCCRVNVDRKAITGASACKSQHPIRISQARHNFQCLVDTDHGTASVHVDSDAVVCGVGVGRARSMVVGV